MECDIVNLWQDEVAIIEYFDGQRGQVQTGEGSPNEEDTQGMSGQGLQDVGEEGEQGEQQGSVQEAALDLST